jgi:hypothetical protein
MKTIEEARSKILAELQGIEDADIRKEFWERYESQIAEFTESLGTAYVNLKQLESHIQGDQERGVVCALVYSTLMLNLLSMKLFLSGNIVAAGALFRQVLESLALSLLCSKKDLGVRSLFANDRYSTSGAVIHMTRKHKQLKLNAEAVGIVRTAQDFYHKYSHVSRFTIASAFSLSEPGLYVGAAFDKGKVDSYDRELQGRLSLARVLPEFVTVVDLHLRAD